MITDEQIRSAAEAQRMGFSDYESNPIAYCIDFARAIESLVSHEYEKELARLKAACDAYSEAEMLCEEDCGA